MKPGIRTAFTLAADQVFTNNDTLANVTGFRFTVGANTQGRLRLWLPIFTGTTGGIKFLLLPTGSPGSYVQQSIVFTPGAAPDIVNELLAPTVTDFALASVGTKSSVLTVEAFLSAGSSAVTYQLQVAQNTADVQTLTIIAGASIEYLQL